LETLSATLQWGHAPKGVEKNSRINRTIVIGMLQWGHALQAVEVRRE
jgi:hypothetical protein